jgi:hypothetical protein
MTANQSLPSRPPGDLNGMRELVQELLAHAQNVRAQASRAYAARDLGIEGPAGSADLAALEDVYRTGSALSGQLEEAAATLSGAAGQLEQQLSAWEGAAREILGQAGGGAQEIAQAFGG